MCDQLYVATRTRYSEVHMETYIADCYIHTRITGYDMCVPSNLYYNISRTLVGNKTVDHADIVLA